MPLRNRQATSEAPQVISGITASRHSDASRRDIVLAVGMLLVAVVAAVFLAQGMFLALNQPDNGGWQKVRIGIFACVLFVFVYGNVIYLVTRLGFFVRRSRHRPLAFETLVASHWDEAEPICILVPSYKEDTRTIKQTLLSAALQHHPNKRVVLLLDDPPEPKDQESAVLLAAARRTVTEVATLLHEPKALIERAFGEFKQRRLHGDIDMSAESRRLIQVHEELMAWMDRCIVEAPPRDHTDRHFLHITFGEHQALLSGSARRLALNDAHFAADMDEIAREYLRLLAVFHVEITVFERKRYQNVSHESNKAANLNTYIGLLGRTVRERQHADGLHLEVISNYDCGDDLITIPDASFILTLDADSMLMPDYALRLSAIFGQEGNERIAVVQTPYTAIPNAPGVVERIAGATTDIQYIVHQGFTWCDATFWVGANALLRKQALDELRTEDMERGYVIAKYIQDRTVIEDTESTVDLAFHGWTLRNYPERLAFSATPPDFGSLLIQRTRWANGGLLIIPKLVRHTLTRRFRAVTIPAFLMRLHYLSSIATGSLGLLILLFLPVDAELFSIWMPVSAAAYFSMYWRDLRLNGYLHGDVLRVFAFNLMLLPVNVAGVLKSIQQGITGKRTPFARTPKVEGRTAAPAWAVVSLWVLLAWSLLGAVLNVMDARWLFALFSMMFASGLAYALVAFVGMKAGWDDATRSIRGSINTLLTRREESFPLEDAL